MPAGRCISAMAGLCEGGCGHGEQSGCPMVAINGIGKLCWRQCSSRIELRHSIQMWGGLEPGTARRRAAMDLPQMQDSRIVLRWNAQCFRWSGRALSHYNRGDKHKPQQRVLASDTTRLIEGETPRHEIQCTNSTFGRTAGIARDSDRMQLPEVARPVEQGHCGVQERPV